MCGFHFFEISHSNLFLFHKNRKKSRNFVHLNLTRYSQSNCRDFHDFLPSQQVKFKKNQKKRKGQFWKFETLSRGFSDNKNHVGNQRRSPVCAWFNTIWFHEHTKKILIMTWWKNFEKKIPKYVKTRFLNGKLFLKSPKLAKTCKNALNMIEIQQTTKKNEKICFRP